jgi:hypothetical protein
MYTSLNIKCRTSRQPTFSFIKTILNKRNRYADCLDLRHFILGQVYNKIHVAEGKYKIKTRLAVDCEPAMESLKNVAF